VDTDDEAFLLSDGDKRWGGIDVGADAQGFVADNVGVVFAADGGDGEFEGWVEGAGKLSRMKTGGVHHLFCENLFCAVLGIVNFKEDAFWVFVESGDGCGGEDCGVAMACDGCEFFGERCGVNNAC